MTGHGRRAARLHGFGTTIFTTISALAVEHDAANLGQGFPDDDAPEALALLAQQAIAAGHNQYAPGRGVPSLRTAIADLQARHGGLAVDAGTEVLVTAGATEAVFCALQAFCDPGDEVVALEPTYDVYGAAAQMAGARLVGVPLVHDGDRFALDPERLRAAITPRTRLLLVNTPHNPTGIVLTDDELAAIAEVALDRDLLVVTDEVYEHLAFARAHRSIATLPDMAERTLTISSAGKSFRVTGWKIGWVTGPAALVDAVATAKQWVTFTNGTPFQHALARFLPDADDHLATQRETYRARRDLLTAGLVDRGFAPVPAEGGYFVCADIRPLGLTDGADLCARMPAALGVAAIPVQGFCADPASLRHLVRFAFCKDLDTIDLALSRLTPQALRALA